jgi:hypothetical protein
MREFRLIVVVLLLPSLIWGLVSACSRGGGEPSAQAVQMEGMAGTSAATTAEPVVQEQEPGAAQEATTVFAAAQIIDLRGLSLPTEIKAMGRSEVGHISFELRDDVASVVGLYEPTFIEDGWRNDAENEYTDETTANRYFTKDGFVVSMLVSSLGEGTIITFVNHGNVALRTLPQTPDAQPLSQFPNRLVYVSPSTVDDVATFTRQALAAQGWHEHRMPGTAKANTSGSQSLMFVQNGLELSALICVAPDQGDKTTVQYGITLLPLDLPVYDEAIGLVFGKEPPYLSYTTATEIDALVDFYRAEMSALGWRELPETANITPERAAVSFVGQKLYANDSEEATVMLELDLIDGQTEVTLHQIDAVRSTPWK